MFRYCKTGKRHYGFYDQIDTELGYGRHEVIGGIGYFGDDDILPYNNETKHLLSTNNDYTEWEPEPNTVIAVRDDEEDDWVYRLFLYKNDINFYVCKVDGTTDEYGWQYATSIEESLKD